MKYQIDFTADKFKSEAGTSHIQASAYLDGDWVCVYKNIPMDRYYTDFVYQDEVQQETADEVKKITGLDLVGTHNFDQGVVLNASLFGGEPQYHSNSTPVLNPAIDDPVKVGELEKRIDALSDEALMHEGVMHQAYWKELERKRNTFGIPLQAPASGGIKGIATLTGQVCGLTNFLMWMYTNPEETAAITALVARTMKRYIRASREYDGKEEMNSLSFASDVSGLMSPADYQKFCGVHEKDLYETFAPTGHRFYHADSNMRQHISALVEIGVAAFNIGPMISTGEILDVAPQGRVHGQIPPTQVLWRGTTDLVVDAVRQDIKEAIDHRAQADQLVCCTAGSINPGTPLDNIIAMHWAAQTYGLIGEDGKLTTVEGPEIEFQREKIVNQIS